AGFSLAPQIAGFRIGQTLVRSHGVTLAVEAAEGTDETIRRGARLAGQGAEVIKAVANEHAFRFDMPTQGPTPLDPTPQSGGPPGGGGEGGSARRLGGGADHRRAGRGRVPLEGVRGRPPAASS